MSRDISIKFNDKSDSKLVTGKVDDLSTIRKEVNVNRQILRINPHRDGNSLVLDFTVYAVDSSTSIRIDTLSITGRRYIDNHDIDQLGTTNRRTTLPQMYEGDDPDTDNTDTDNTDTDNTDTDNTEDDDSKGFPTWGYIAIGAGVLLSIGLVLTVIIVIYVAKKD